MPNFLSTHPNPGDRIQRIRELTAGRPPEKRPMPCRISRYLSAIDGLVLGEDPRQGFVEGNVFYHPALRFRFPVPRGFQTHQPTRAGRHGGKSESRVFGFCFDPRKISGVRRR